MYISRPERPKSAKVRKQLAQASEQPSPVISSSPPRTDGQTHVYEYLGHLEGQKKRRGNLSEEERVKEDEEVLRFLLHLRPADGSSLENWLSPFVTEGMSDLFKK